MMMTMMIIATTMTTPPAAAEDATALTEPAVVSEVVAMKQSRIKQDSNNTTVDEHPWLLFIRGHRSLCSS